MASRRRSLMAGQMTPAKLTDRTVGAWLNPGEVENMRDLLARSATTTGNESRKLVQEAWRQFHGAWGYNLAVGEVIAWWAEDRRQRACIEWLRDHPGRLIDEFGPFDDHRADL